MTGTMPQGHVLQVIEKDAAEVLESRGATVANIRDQRQKPKGFFSGSDADDSE